MEVSGWLLFASSELIKAMKKLPENHIFFYSDNDYIARVQKLGYKHFMLTHAEVLHVGKGSNTFKTVDDRTRAKFIRP